MTFEVAVLGGSAAWPNPGQGCSSYLVATSVAQLLFDCGPDTLLELRKHTLLNEIDAIVISHCHADHILDLIPMRYALVYSAERANTRIPLWLPPGGTAVFEALGDTLGMQGEKTTEFWGEVFDVKEYDPARVLEVGDCKHHFAPTQHFTTCYAIRIGSMQNTAIVYGADTGNVEALIDFAAGVELLISEATADSHDGIDPEVRGHLTPEDAGRWAAASDVSRLLITHLWHERDDRDVIRRAASLYSGPIDLAKPGLKLYV